MGVSVADAPRENSSPVATGTTRRKGHPAPLGFLPDELHIPDGYDLEFDRPIKRFANPVDRDRIVAFDLFSRKRAGWMATVIYDKENKGTYSHSGPLFRLRFEYEF